MQRRGLVVAYLPQHPGGDGRTPVELLRDARPDLTALEAELDECTERLGSPETAGDLDLMARLLRRQEDIVARHEAAGGASV